MAANLFASHMRRMNRRAIRALLRELDARERCVLRTFGGEVAAHEDDFVGGEGQRGEAELAVIVCKMSRGGVGGAKARNGDVRVEGGGGGGKAGGGRLRFGLLGAGVGFSLEVLYARATSRAVCAPTEPRPRLRAP